MAMTFEAFMSKMLKPTYVYRMAWGLAGPWAKDEHPRVKGARTRIAKAQREIDDLVLARSLVIADERRCAALGLAAGAVVPAIRCEFNRGHGPVGPGIADSRVSHVTARRDWDHGAPKAGIWWMDTADA